ncbi:hypothetical protein MVES_003675 [Malassezia vespertilionis]|uniref:CHORD domain-containing protein n=2 Tax=Malassezia vespertilionis TaxID=2020962 RepID=A0A2N1J7D7_9BASI|nr:hypothetical protein MVES_003675 [Malassezia vespertilionis]
MGPCRYHPGAPVFHEGLKSWSCCKDLNKPVMEFDQFLAIQGCATTPAHTTQKQSPPPSQRPGGKVGGPEPGAEPGAATSEPQPPPKESAPQPLNLLSHGKAPAVPKPAEAACDPDTLTHVDCGARCSRTGCNYVADMDMERDRAGESCMYHPGVPVFHEGSKGYTCCKPRSLHFCDFLQIAPCTRAVCGHMFSAPPPAKHGAATHIRIDHYETPAHVHVTVYAKNIDPAQSLIVFEHEHVVLSLLLAPMGSITEPRRFDRTLEPYAAIDPSASTYTIGKMKLDL